MKRLGLIGLSVIVAASLSTVVMAEEGHAKKADAKKRHGNGGSGENHLGGQSREHVRSPLRADYTSAALNREITNAPRRVAPQLI